MSSGRPLRIGLNLMALTAQGGGASRYMSELVPALRKVAPEVELTVFVGSEAPPEFLADPRNDGVAWARLRVGTSHRMHVAAQLAWLPVLARRRGLDVLHSTANIGPLLTPGTARVVTLLDVIWLHQGERWEGGRAAAAFARLSRICARNADRLITISESARADIAASLGLGEDRIDVAPLGVRTGGFATPTDGAELRRRFELGHEQVVLCVAQKRPYKNLGSLIRALARLDGTPMLVLPGASTPHEQELRALADSLGVGERVRFPAWVSEADLEGLYRLASCFALPSLIEGFGLPVLEAMARGVPVACSNRPALPEVAGDAALLFDPEDQDAVTSAIERLLRDRDLAVSLVERGRERVRLFTWERTAEATLACYRRVLGAAGSSAGPV